MAELQRAVFQRHRRIGNDVARITCIGTYSHRHRRLRAHQGQGLAVLHGDARRTLDAHETRVLGHVARIAKRKSLVRMREGFGSYDGTGCQLAFGDQGVDDIHVEGGGTTAGTSTRTSS